MKFAEHLSAHITPEWRKQYIAYEVSAPEMPKNEENENFHRTTHLDLK
jgi:SPX domain protein involved in polyphosphate accumulation